MTRTIIAAAIAAVTENAAGHATLTDAALRDYSRTIEAEASRFALDPLVLIALVSRESDWRPHALNADTGATGLMQIVASPEVLAGGFAQFADQLQDPRVNVFLGARRLRRFIDMCGGDVWRGVDGFNGRGVRRKTLSQFAADVRRRWERLEAVASAAVVAETMEGRR